MITNMQIREALLDGMNADTVRSIPEHDIDLIRKALVPEADVEGLPSFLFSDGAREAITTENLDQLTELSREHFAKALPPELGEPQEDAAPGNAKRRKPKKDMDKLKGMAEEAFGTKPDTDGDEEDLDDDDDLDDDLDEEDLDDDDYGDEGDEDEEAPEDAMPPMLPPKTAKQRDVEKLKKALAEAEAEAEAELHYEGDPEGAQEYVVDAEDLLEPIYKAYVKRDESLEALLQEVLRENREMRTEIRGLRKGLVKVTDALERIEPIQKAFAGFMGDQAFPAGRPPSGAVIAARQDVATDFDLSPVEFEEVLQKGLALGLIDAGMSGTLRAHWGTPNMALHHQAMNNLMQSVKSMEDRASRNGGN